MLVGESIAARDASGALVAAASLSVRRYRRHYHRHGAPPRRGEGLGTRLLQWARDRGRSRAADCRHGDALGAGRAAVRAVRAGRGVRRGCDASRPVRRPHLPAPEGISLTPVSIADHTLLFEAYARSFADRPGFTVPIAAEWLDELIEDPDYRADLSLLATDVDQPVGFVNVLGTWVDQVGVVPPYRGRRLGAHPVAHVLGALAAEGADGRWLTVNVDNPADQLYRSLGFRVVGRRARYARRLSLTAG